MFIYCDPQYLNVPHKSFPSRRAPDLIRAALDNLAGRTLAQRVTKEQLAHLKQLVKRMEQAAKKRHIAEYYPLNLEFHRSEEHTSELQSLIRISYALSCLKTQLQNNQLFITQLQHY